MENNRLNAIIGGLAVKYGTAPKMSEEERTAWQVKNFNDSVGNLNELDGLDCKRCKNKGFIARVDENGYEVTNLCRCQRTRETLLRAKRSGLGDILKDMTFDKFVASDDWQIANKAKAQAFCKDDAAGWFYIGGQVGAGKTHLCTAICGHYIKAGKDVQYMLWCEESKRLKALVTENAEYQATIKKYKDADVLYIDDFLKTKKGETPTQADINLAFEIINSRFMRGDLITVISSEKTLSELLYYDEATMSRIYQRTGEYKINIEHDTSRNYRLRG